MSEIAIDYWQLFQRKGDKLLVLLGKPKKPQVKKIVTSYLFVIIGLLTVVFILISAQLYITSMGYTISQLQKQLHQLENAQRILLVDASSLRSASRIEKIAIKMGLIIPDEVDIIYLPEPQYLTQNKQMVENFLNLFKSRKAEAVVRE